MKENPVYLTPELIKSIFATYGEGTLISDEELIQEMIHDVTQGDPKVPLNAESFAQALSGDVLLYDVSKESRVSTFYEDVFGTEAEKYAEKDQDNNNNNDEKLRLKDKNTETAEDIESPTSKDEKDEFKYTNKFTFSQIDFTTDSMRSKVHLAMAYLSFIFVAYRFKAVDFRPEVCQSSSFGCSIANTLCLWLIIMSSTM